MKKLLLLLSAVFLSTSALAVPVTTTILGYNIQNAAPSGTGGWAHQYNGTITDLGNGLKDYTGGTSGTGSTLADGILTSDTSSTQLFRTVDDTSITIFLNDYYALESVSIFGGSVSNNISGSITSADFSAVSNNGSNLFTTITSTPFGATNLNGTPVNDLFSFNTPNHSASSELVNQFTISNITGNWSGYYSISEIQVTVSPIPEPSTYALMLGGLGLIGFMAARRRRTA